MEQVCEKALNVKLYPSTGQGCLSKELSQQIYELWLTTCGIPRVIENLVYQLRKTKTFDTLLTTTNLETINKSLAIKHSFDHIKELLPRISAKKWNQLLLDFIFCKAKAPQAKITPSKRYYDLEAAGSIIPFAFDIPVVEQTFTGLEPRNYTIPFFSYTQVIQSPMGAAFQGKYKRIDNPHHIDFREYMVKIEQVIKVVGRTVAKEEPLAGDSTELHFKGTFIGYNAGTILEEATACSLWLRYLQATELTHGQLASMSDILPGINCPDLYVSLIHTYKHLLMISGCLEWGCLHDKTGSSLQWWSSECKL